MPVRKNPYELFWDRFAKLYSPMQEQKNIGLYDGVGAFINNCLNNEMFVLELACGTGQITKRCCDQVMRWTATDFSDKMIECAKKECKTENVTFETADAHNLRYTDENFDAIVIANALHIMPEPEKALSEIGRVLKKEGILIAPTFVYDSTANVKRNIKLMLMKSMGFKTFSKWTSLQYREFVEQNGFRVTQEKLFGNDFLPECILVCKRGGE